MSNAEKNKQDGQDSRKKSGCLMKLFKCFLWLIGVVFVLWLVLFLVNDRSVKYVAVNDVYDEVDYSKGEAPDFRALYDELQKKDVFPIEENGWVEVFKALGPGAIEQQYSADRTKWEDYGSTKESKAAYEESWAPLCEKLGLDPRDKPLFYDRLKLIPYLVKNGLTGAEVAPELDADDAKAYEYWENAEAHTGKVTVEAANAAYEKLREAPWSAQDYPMAAQWFAENDDMMTVVAEAARKPKFHGCKLIPSQDATMYGMLLPDTQHMREQARLFQSRANLRVGSGDISGAIDDVETIVSFARRLYDDESSLLVERLVGLACLGIAGSVPLYANPEAQPSVADIERIASLWRACYGADALDARNAANQRTEFMFGCGMQMDVTHSLGSGDLQAIRDFEILSVCDYIGGDDCKSPLATLVAKAIPINERNISRIFREHYLELLKLPAEERVEKLDALITGHKWYSYRYSETFALSFLSLVFPAYDAAERAFARGDCSFKMLTVAQAIGSYVDANGTLPPAYTVDANGAPLHSWRVLILPYLGDDAKALYDQIRLDEPWDSEHNSAFHDQMPDVFRCSGAKQLTPGETLLSVLIAQDGLFDRSGVGKDPKALLQREGRDSIYQAMIVERRDPICWMTPDKEIDVDQAFAAAQAKEADENEFTPPNAIRGISPVFDVLSTDVHSGGGNFVSLAGSLRFLSYTHTDEKLRLYLLGVPEPEEEDETTSEP